MSVEPVDAAAVQSALADFQDPETGRAAMRMDQIRDIRVSDNVATLTFAITTHSAVLWPDVEQALEERLKAKFPQLTTVKVERAIHNRPPQKQGPGGLAVKTVIAVGSGKGGVGKSTIAVCLAFALHRAGSNVGLVDADVYGPSVPHLTGTTGQGVQQLEDNRIMPVMKDGMPIMSIGYMVPPDQAIIWRGPMLHGAITQFLQQTKWGELDYLIIDMPPGTGDVALTLSQALPLGGAVVVCTPQQVALIDAVKAISMFRRVNIPILGMVENMSTFICPDNGKRYDIFGSGGARRKAEELNVPFLGEVPINVSLRERGDEGETALNFEDPLVAPYLNRIAYSLVKNLSNAAASEPHKAALPVLG